MDPIIHKTAEVSPQAKIGPGSKIWNNSQVMAGALIGENCVIGHNCVVMGGAAIGNGVRMQSNTDVWEGVTLQDDVFVGPSAVFTNDPNPRAKYPKKDFPEYGKWLPTLVKAGATIGANATIICGSTIGRWAFVGAGAVVAADVPDYALVAGVPAKQIGWVCECGNRLDFIQEKAFCAVCGRAYLKKETGVEEIK